MNDSAGDDAEDDPGPRLAGEQGRDAGAARRGTRRPELRQSVSAYDATYVALAEALDATLVTTDRRLAGAAGMHAAVELH
jgi:hypothetical protein